ncbi:DUF2895 family protein, partial [Pseudomonas syringae pv. tagetis]
CWWRSSKHFTVHVSPYLRFVSTGMWWYVCPLSVYTFGLYFFQQMKRWPVDGEQGYQAYIPRLDAYITASCEH